MRLRERVLMCDWGDSVVVSVLIPASVSCTGSDRRARKPIDRCLAPIVEALDRAGVRMTGSCCGHGRSPATIALDDGSELVRLKAGWQLSIPGSWEHPASRARSFDRVLVSVPEHIAAALASEKGHDDGD